VKNQETLKSSTIISKLANAVKDKVNNLLSNGVMTSCVVIGSIFFARNNLLRMVKLAISSRTDFIADSGLEINVNRTWYVFCSAGLREKGIEGIVSAPNSLVRRHLPIRLDTVLETIQLPAPVTRLDTGLAHVN